MMKKKSLDFSAARIFTVIAVLLFFLGSAGISAQTAGDSIRHEVLLVTTKGDIKIALYNETPLHRDNFLKHVRSGYYDGLLFHRVIFNFMIQTGDSASRNAKPGQLLGNSSEADKIPAEILYPKYFHKRGAVAAAREGDDTNPDRASSSTQFYIVYGRRFNDAMLDEQQGKLDKSTGGKVKLLPEIRDVYKAIGGAPHLDGQYTVFGEIIEGLDVVKDIEWVDTDENARPREDIRIIKATVVK